MTDFLPTNYEVPQKPGNYMKFLDGENRFRILASPIIGWVAWEDTKEGGRKPIRHRMDEPFDPGKVDPENIKHFWAMPVYNYTDKRVQILEITQKTIQRELKTLARNKAWGSPLGYNLAITRTGQKLDTEYTIVPEPPTPLDKEIKEAFEGTTINLEALYSGEDPFVVSVDPNDVDENI